jgi:predicted phosphodiesterase
MQLQLNEQPIVVIGDIHGRADLLEKLLAEIVASVPGARIIFLGDLIDRGPSSARVLDMVHELKASRPGTELILGNHDFYMREHLRGTLTDEDAGKWFQWGGMQTLHSYSPVGIDTLKQYRDLVLSGYPLHQELLESAKSILTWGDYCFVHAGIRPGLPLADQAEHDLMWIREGFLDYEGHLPAIVVHGHSITPSRMPQVNSNRIAIDTGAYGTGRLTAAVFERNSLSHFLCTETSPTGRIHVDLRDKPSNFDGV